MQLSVRDVDKRIFRRFKVLAVQRGMKLGTALAMAMNQWIAEAEGKKRSLLDFKPMRLGKDTKHLSMEVDKILYGE